jgi:hypothetical protein
MLNLWQNRVTIAMKLFRKIETAEKCLVEMWSDGLTDLVYRKVAISAKKRLSPTMILHRQIEQLKNNRN